MRNQQNSDTVEIDHSARAHDRLAPFMFLFTLVFLAVLAALIVCVVDIPRVAELAVAESVEAAEDTQAAVAVPTSQLQSGAQQISRWLFFTLLLMWPVYWIECAWRYLSHKKEGDKNPEGGATDSSFSLRSALPACLVPPLRLGTVIAEKGNQLWLPVMGWQSPGKKLLKRLESIAARPMLMVAFLILPVLLLEYAFSNFVQNNPWLQITLHTATGFIWWSFTIEFIVMVSATKKKFQYIKKNWIDLVIIVLPLVSFLRTIRILRLAKLARVQQITKVTRMYRMRGLIANVMRGFMLTELVNKVLRIKPEKTLAKLQESKANKEQELQAIQSKIEMIEDKIRLSKQAA